MLRALMIKGRTIVHPSSPTYLTLTKFINGVLLARPIGHGHLDENASEMTWPWDGNVFVYMQTGSFGSDVVHPL